MSARALGELTRANHTALSATKIETTQTTVVRDLNPFLRFSKKSFSAGAARRNKGVQTYPRVKCRGCTERITYWWFARMKATANQMRRRRVLRSRKGDAPRFIRLQ